MEDLSRCGLYSKVAPTFFPHEINGPNRKKGKFKTRLLASLKTDSLEWAQLRSPPIVQKFQAMIRAAKQQIEPSTFDFDKAVKSYSESFKALGGGEEARTHISHQVPLKEAETEKEMAQINKEQLIAQGAAIWAGLATSIYLEEWLSRCQHKSKGRMKLKDLLNRNFAKGFLFLS